MSAAPLLTEMAEGVLIRPMITPEKAVDLFLGDITRRNYSPRTIDTYRRVLYEFCDSLPRDLDIGEVKPDDVRRYLDRRNGRKRRGRGTYTPGYRASIESAVASFFKWLYDQEKIKRNPLDKIQRTRRLPAEDLDVVTVSSADVRLLLEEALASPSWTERLAVAIPAYLGSRRHAIAMLRVTDYNMEQRRLRFHEKGNRIIWKPVPDELADLLDEAIRQGAILPAPDDYLVPPAGRLLRHGERDDRVVWNAVRQVAERVGVKTHVHALRAAFAVFYLEEHIGDTEALQALMGHKSIATTETYLRRLDRNVAMERVRGLSWTGSEGGGNREHLSSAWAAAPSGPEESLTDALTERARAMEGDAAHTKEPAA